jgi:hypothetical protein
MLTDAFDQWLVAKLGIPFGVRSCFRSAHGYSFLNSKGGAGEIL